MLAALYAVFLVCALRHQATPLVDDAAINYRYVDQIVAGHGIVYNTGGPRVYGCSALPFTLAIAFIHWGGVSDQSATFWLNAISFFAALALLYALCTHATGLGKAQEMLTGPMALIPCALALFQGTTLVWITQGLESGFHLLLCALCVWCYDRRREYACGLLLALAVMNKLDAVSLGAAIVAFSLLRERRIPLRLIGTALLAYLPWLLFTTLYFGSPIPMSLQAKQLHEFADRGHEFLWHYAQAPLPVLLGLSAAFFLRRRFVGLLALWFLAYVGLYDVTTRAHPFEWYYFPSDFVIMFLAGITLVRLMTGLRPQWTFSRSFIRPAVGVLSALLAVYLGGSDWLTARTQLRGWQRWAAGMEGDRVEIGDWLHQYGLPTESVGTAHGWIAYLSGMTAYDYSGLNDPELVRLARAGREGEYLMERRPQYLAGQAFAPPAALQNQYVLLARFTRTQAASGTPNWELWGRKDCAALKELGHSGLPLIYPVTQEIRTPAQNNGK